MRTATDPVSSEEDLTNLMCSRLLGFTASTLESVNASNRTEVKRLLAAGKGWAHEWGMGDLMFVELGGRALTEALRVEVFGCVAWDYADHSKVWRLLLAAAARAHACHMCPGDFTQLLGRVGAPSHPMLEVEADLTEGIEAALRAWPLSNQEDSDEADPK